MHWFSGRNPIKTNKYVTQIQKQKSKSSLSAKDVGGKQADRETNLTKTFQLLHLLKILISTQRWEK